MKVSIVMPYFNEPLLRRAVDAVRQQTHTDWHLYVVDDGSKVAAGDVLGELPQVTVLWQANQGVAGARNTALDAIRADGSQLVAYCDADDCWDRDYLERQVAALADCDLVYATPRYRWFNGDEAYPYGITDYATYPGLDALVAGNFIYVSGVVHRKECLSVGNFNPELNSIEDWDYWTRIAKAGFRLKKSDARFTYTVKFDGNASKSNDHVYELFHQLHRRPMPRISIVIPTYLRTDKLKECLASIVEYTNPEDCCVVVVANGAIQETATVYDEFTTKWKGEAKLLWFNDPLGYPRACNEGIRATDSEYVILLNDDCLLLPQPINEWVDVLLKPFLDDGAVGITGPQRLWDENSEHQFLIFFCVMLRRRCLDEIGLLDESTGLGFGEDTIACIEAERKGWKVLQVPNNEVENTLADIDPATTTLETWKHDKIWAGNFRLFHDAESTLGRIPESDDVLRRNRAMLRERYGNHVNTQRAASIDGWFALDEIEWLAKQVKALPKGAVVVEVGSWKGRSSAAIADNLPEGGKLYCVDTWVGSSGEPTAHLTAREREGDNVYMAFYHNLHDHLDRGSVVAVRMSSAHAAETLNNLRPDLIWIDGDHSKEGITTDVESWLPLLRHGGLLCGHDYYREGESEDWIYVRQYVETRFPQVQKAATSIWYVRPHIEERGKVMDAFIFSNELDLLELRLSTLDAVVDRFVLVEGTRYHSGDPKPLFFDEAKERFRPWLHKITHVVVDDWAEDVGNVYDRAWARERHQRDAILHGLRNCADNDIVILGDADEIPSPEVIAAYKVSDGLVRLKQRMFYYYLNCENKDGWDWQKVAPYKVVKELTPCGIRYPPAGELPLVEGGGWHWSMLGGAESVSTKLSTYSHQEFNTPEVNNVARLGQLIERGEDIFGRDLKYEFVTVDDTYPQYVRDNYPRLCAQGLVRVEPKVEAPEVVVDFAARRDSLARKKHWTVTAEASTKDRYATTLPLTLSAIINQTRKPDKLKIYDDGEHRVSAEQLAATSPFDGLLRLATDKHVDWEILHTPRKGQVANHQHCLDSADTDFIWRVDDDEIPEPNCLKVLVDTLLQHGNGGQFDRVGAVGGLVHNPGAVSPLPRGVDGSLNDIGIGLNVAWFSWNSGPRECEHLYSTFLYRVAYGREVGGYPTELSPVGHREESWFTNKLHRAGYKVLCTPHTVTHHLRESSGGIRSFTDTALWEQDEAKWQEYLRAAGRVLPESKLIVCDFGLGDHLILKGIWPELQRKFPERRWTMALCYPEVFKDEDVTVISIADAKALLGHRYDDYSVYAHAWKNNFERPMPEVMMEFYGQ